MEWVETTGPSVEAALDAALDELGVDDDEVEYEVLEEARSGLFGRLGSHPARIRARVKPLSREKPGERNRGRQPRRGGNRRGGPRGGERAEKSRRGPAPAGGKKATDAPRGEATGEATGETPPSGGGARKRTRSRNRRRSGAGTSAQTGNGSTVQEDSGVTTEEVPIGEQADVADEFVRGLVDAFGVEAEVSVTIDDDAVLVDVEGPDLGLLVGPKGATLRAIEDLVRTVVQRRTDGQGARIHVDVGGYQAKRRDALTRFATDLANRVLDSGRELALEPMPPADRKVVHDTVAAIDGVTTTSEGEEPRRRVVIRRT